MKTIVQKDDPVLRRIAKEVDPASIATPKFQELLDEMKKALDSQDDGVAIAAPQIGESLRVFMVSGKALARAEHNEDEKSLENDYDDLICINPTLDKLSRKKNDLEEGCLSVRYLYGRVARAEKATVTALDRRGVKFTRGATGLLAQIFQHELDHLNGVLFIDKARDIKDIPPSA